MEKKYDVVALGELLIDFTQVGKSDSWMNLFEQNPGGAVANLLTTISHMGHHGAFIGKVGLDMHGQFLKDTLLKEKINCDGLVMDPNYFTTLAFVGLDAKKERHFSFARKPGADMMLGIDDLNLDLLNNCRIFHFGSLSLTHPTCEQATLKALQQAKLHGAIISYDPNYRASLWESEAVAVSKINSVIEYVDMMKVSDQEAFLLTQATTYEEACDILLDKGVKIVAITLGKEGVMLACRNHKAIIKGFEVNVVDTTSAGDSFWGGFLSSFIEHNQSINDFDFEILKRCATYGNGVAALCIQKRGGIPSIPNREMVKSFLYQQKRVIA